MTRSSYQLTATCVERRDAGHSGATIARVVGRSETWVSRHLAAWDGAGRELHHAWEEGRLTDDAVMRIAALPRERQAAAVANPTQSKRSGTSASMKHKWTVRRIDAVLQIVQANCGGGSARETARGCGHRTCGLRWRAWKRRGTPWNGAGDDADTPAPSCSRVGACAQP